MKETPIKLKDQACKELPFVSDFSSHLSFVIGSIGRYSSGKTRLPVTGPDLTGIIPIDQKTRRTVENTMKELGKKFNRNILMPPVDFLKEMNPMAAARLNEEDSKEHYRTRVERVKEYALGLHAHPDVRLICLDTFAQFYQDICYAIYGRTGHKYKKLDGGKSFQDRSDANQEAKDFIRALASKPLLLTNTEKDLYEGNKVVGKTNEGFKFLGNSCEAMIWHEANNAFDAEDENKNWKFAVTYIACQSNVELQGPDGRRYLTDELITFENVARAAFPDADEGMFA